MDLQLARNLSRAVHLRHSELKPGIHKTSTGSCCSRTGSPTTASTRAISIIIVVDDLHSTPARLDRRKWSFQVYSGIWKYMDRRLSRRPQAHRARRHCACPSGDGDPASCSVDSLWSYRYKRQLHPTAVGIPQGDQTRGATYAWPVEPIMHAGRDPRYGAAGQAHHWARRKTSCH